MPPCPSQAISAARAPGSISSRHDREARIARRADGRVQVEVPARAGRAPSKKRAVAAISVSARAASNVPARSPRSVAEHAVQVGVDEALAGRDGVDVPDAQHQVHRQLPRGRARQRVEQRARPSRSARSRRRARPPTAARWRARRSARAAFTVSTPLAGRPTVKPASVKRPADLAEVGLGQGPDRLPAAHRKRLRSSLTPSR